MSLDLNTNTYVGIRFLFLHYRQLILLCYQFKLKKLGLLHDTFYSIISNCIFQNHLAIDVTSLRF